MKILVTGGAGYIGSHTYLKLREAGHEPIIFDDFSNSSHEVIGRLQTLFQKRPTVIEGDIRDRAALEAAIRTHKCEAVIHFAGAKAVGESMANPLKYYSINVAGSQSLLEAMNNCGVKKLIFSSSATVYGEPEVLPIPEDHGLCTASVYGETKLMVENMLRALYSADPEWSIVILRYFNPVGAHASGLIGEDPSDIPNNLMPYVSQVAVGRREKLHIFGGDYDTHDGTGVRDFIHVVDLAAGHVAALKLLKQSQCTPINLGTGNGVSVLDMVHAFEGVIGREIPHVIVERRGGDVASSYADPSRAQELLGWKATYNVLDMCRDAWKWQSLNPMGYRDTEEEKRIA